MLTRLMPEQANSYWQVIFEYSKQAMPQHLRDSLKESSMLESVLNDTMQVWVTMIEDQIHAIALTSIIDDLVYP